MKTLIFRERLGAGVGVPEVELEDDEEPNTTRPLVVRATGSVALFVVREALEVCSMLAVVEAGPAGSVAVAEASVVTTRAAFVREIEVVVVGFDEVPFET